MVLAHSELKKVIKDFKNINPEDIRGSSIDLSITEKAKIPNENIVIDLFNEKPNEDEIEKYFKEIELAKGYEIKPNSFFYTSTAEYIKIPQNMCGIILPRSTFARIGLTLPSSMYANPGYEGHLPLIIHNHSPFTVKIPPYYKVAQLLLLEIKGESIPYEHQATQKYHKEGITKNPEFDDFDFEKILEKISNEKN